MRGVDTAIRSGSKSWFGDVGLSTSDSILNLLFLFVTVAPTFDQT